jgi:hypothetical protein
MSAVLENLGQISWNKGYMYGTDQGGGTNAIGFGALQNVSVTHTKTFAELNGPESLAPLGVGIKGEEVSGSWEYGVISPEQYQMAHGGDMAYDAGTNTTTYTKKVEDEPTPFDLEMWSDAANPSLKVHLYNCLATSWNVVKAENRAWNLGMGNFRAYGQSIATYGSAAKLYTVTRPGNLTNSS